MKIEELQIGDWYWIELEGVKYPMQVTQSTFTLSNDEIARFEPIPLTYEILESNFGKNESKLNIHPQYLAYPKHEMIGVQLKPKPDCRKLLEVFNYDNNRGMKYECNRPDDVEQPFYVHELQHMLRKCKINDEIIL